MPKRTWDKDYAGVWYIESTVPGKVPPKPDKVFYINYRQPGDRRKIDEKIGRKSEGWKPGTVNAVRSSRMTGQTVPKAEIRRQEAEEERNKPITFGQYAQDWLDGHVSTNLKPSSKRGYESLLDNLILPALKDRQLTEITREEVKELGFSLLQEGRIRPKATEDKKVKDATLSARTVVYVVRTISAIYNHAIEDGIVQINPALRPGRFIKTDTRREKVDILSPAEGDLVLTTAEKYYGRTFPLLLCAMRTGMRQGELIALEWSDIDWNGNFIEVRRSTWRGITGTPKSGKIRRVDMNDRLKAVLQQHQTKMKAEALKAGVATPVQVFTTDELTPYDGVNVRKRFEVVLRKAKLRKIRFHDLRHSYASWLIANKESLAYVRDQLGHLSIQITVDLYGHLIPGENREAVNRLDAPQPAPQVLANK